MTIWKHFLLIAVSLLLAVLRALGCKSESFQAIAHLWIGFLIGVALLRYYTPVILVILLSVVEVICFFVLPRT